MWSGSSEGRGERRRSTDKGKLMKFQSGRGSGDWVQIEAKKKRIDLHLRK